MADVLQGTRHCGLAILFLMHCHHYAANRCRSCTAIEVSYATQVSDKLQHCRTLLAAHDHVQWLPPVASAESGFRNKAKMVVSGSIEAPVLGIRDARGLGVDLSDCALYPAALQIVFPQLAGFIRKAEIDPYDIDARQGEIKFLLLTRDDTTGALMLRFVLRSQEPIARIRKHLPELMQYLPDLRVVSANLQPEHKAVIEGEREIALAGEPSLVMHCNGLSLRLRPRSFFQTNSAVAAALYAQASEWITERNPASVWDLFCGVGGFALHVADGVRCVTGVEISDEAVQSARLSAIENARTRVRFEAADALAFAPTHAAPECVIVNPPRRGIGSELASWLDASPVMTVLYSSCNAESLARDLQAMPAFELHRARLFDMFPHTHHYEVLAELRRRA